MGNPLKENQSSEEEEKEVGAGWSQVSRGRGTRLKDGPADPREPEDKPGSDLVCLRLNLAADWHQLHRWSGSPGLTTADCPDARSAPWSQGLWLVGPVWI